MANITSTAHDAVVSYYNVLKRMGNIKKQDKYRLLVLWFFNYLRNESDFLYEWDCNLKKFKVNKKLEAVVQKMFNANMQCLMQSSCFIKMHNDDNCVPLSGMDWDTIDGWHFIVTNATPHDKVDGSYPADNIINVLDMIFASLGEGEAFMIDKDGAFISPDKYELKTYDDSTTTMNEVESSIAAKDALGTENIIYFGQTCVGEKGEKGDKGDQGESWDNEFDIAENPDIDALFT